jgi:hypothetical protein
LHRSHHSGLSKEIWAEMESGRSQDKGLTEEEQRDSTLRLLVTGGMSQPGLITEWGHWCLCCLALRTPFAWFAFC